MVSGECVVCFLSSCCRRCYGCFHCCWLFCRCGRGYRCCGLCFGLLGCRVRLFNFCCFGWFAHRNSWLNRFSRLSLAVGLLSRSKRLCAFNIPNCASRSFFGRGGLFGGLQRLSRCCLCRCRRRRRCCLCLCR